MKITTALAGAVALVLLVGCGNEGRPAEGGGGGGGSVSGEVTVTNHPALLYSPPWIAAVEQGLFKKQGVEITGIVGSEGGGTTVQNVVSGGLPLGEVATSAAITAFQAGVPLKIVGGGVGSGDDVFWVTGPDSSIKSIEDLRGKTVGYTSPGSVTQGLLALSLERAGVGVDNVKTRAMGGLSEGLTALKNGDIDAAAILEPVFSEQVEKEGWKPVFRVSEYVPDFLATVIITGPGVLEKNPDFVRKAIAARAEAIEYLKANPKEVADAWAREAEIRPENALKAIKSVDPDEHWVVGLDNTKALEAVVEEMRLIDLLKDDQQVDWNKLVNQDFVPADQRIQLPASG